VLEQGREPSCAEMEGKGQDCGGTGGAQRRIEGPAQDQKGQDDASAWAAPPQFNGADAQGHRSGGSHQPSCAPVLNLNDEKRLKPIAKNRGDRYAAQTNHDDRRKDPPGAVLLEVGGNRDCRRLDDERRERFDRPTAWKQKGVARLV
jgi:hypothetical protein